MGIFHMQWFEKLFHKIVSRKYGQKFLPGHLIRGENGISGTVKIQVNISHQSLFTFSWD